MMTAMGKISSSLGISSRQELLFSRFLYFSSLSTAPAKLFWRLSLAKSEIASQTFLNYAPC